MIDRSSRRRFGQNYLRDKSVIYQIVDKINPGKEDSFIEIGPCLLYTSDAADE